MTWGIHTHNDAELAVANSIAAVQAGVRHVQATINGYGERCGNANMVSILANLALKTPEPLVPAGGGDLAALTQLSRAVAEIANQVPNDYQPYVGRSAFAHKGGVHGAAVAKVERSYQHVDPGAVGNAGRLVVSELGGRANTEIRARQLGHELEGLVDPRELSKLIKQLEHEGLAFEGAEASFELLIRRHAAGLRRARSASWTTPSSSSSAPAGSSSPRRPSRWRSTARCSTPPPTATARSTRSTARCARRCGRSTRSSTASTSSTTRCASSTAPPPRPPGRGSSSTRRTARPTWSTMGSDTNIIAASAQALADSLEYAIWKSGAELRRRDERHFTTTNGQGTAAASPPEPDPAAAGGPS